MTRRIPFEEAPDSEWRSRAAAVIPGGSSTGSKRPEALYGSRAHDAAVPSHYEPVAAVSGPLTAASSSTAAWPSVR